MNDENRVTDLFNRWVVENGQGKDLTVNALCADCPELIEAVRQRILQDVAVLEYLQSGFGGSVHQESCADLPYPEIPGYEILDVLGSGGMGVVYKARQSNPKRLVALKMILSGRHIRPDLKVRFQTEANAVASLVHPNIVQIYQVGEHDGQPFFSLEYVDGGTLSDKIDGKPVKARYASEMIRTLASAVHAAHENGIIHRDLKPLNVLLTRDGIPRITDFGLAKQLDTPGLTQDDQLLGTPSYMAPEQAAPNGPWQIGPKTDVYALGAILYELLTGRPPFLGADKCEMLARIGREDPVPPRRLQPTVPRDLETISLKCLEKEPARRYASAAELAEDLRRFQDGEPIRARPASRRERIIKLVKRRPAVSALLGAVIALLLVGTGVSLYFAVDASLEATRARENEDKANRKEEAAKKSEAAAIAARDELRKKNDELELTLARSLLRPLGMPEFKQRMGQPQLIALWELAIHRKSLLWYRFIEDAVQKPETSRQLKYVAQPALNAAIGLDLKRLKRIDSLFRQKLGEAGVLPEHRADVAVIAASMGEWSTDTATVVVRILAQELARIADDKDSWAENPSDRLYQTVSRFQELTQGLSAVSTRADPNVTQNACAGAATILADTISRVNLNHKMEMCRSLSTVAYRLNRTIAGKTCATAGHALIQEMPRRSGFDFQHFGPALTVLCPHLEAGDLAKVGDRLALLIVKHSDELPSASKYNQSGEAVGLRSLARALRLAIEMMPPAEAKKYCAKAIRAITTVAAKTDDAEVRRYLVDGIGELTHCVDSADATGLADVLSAGIRSTRHDVADDLGRALRAVALRLEHADMIRFSKEYLDGLVRSSTMHERRSASQCLRAMAVSMQAGDAAAATTLLSAAIRQVNKDEQITVLDYYAGAMAAVVTHVKPNERERACSEVGQAIGTLLASTDDATVSWQAPRALRMIAPHIEPETAAQIAAGLTQAMRTANDPVKLGALARGLTPVAKHMKRPDAVEAATALVTALSKPVSGRLPAQWEVDIGDALVELAPQMDKKWASQAVDLLTQTMRRAFYPEAVAQRVAGLSRYMDSREAVEALFQLTKRVVTGDAMKEVSYALSRAQANLSAVEAVRVQRMIAQLALEYVGAEDTTTRDMTYLRYLLSSDESVARCSAAVGMGATSICIWTVVPVLEPPPCRLSTEQLVDLLRVPNCVGRVRRIVLDCLQNRYGRVFGSQWDFVQFAKEKGIELDFVRPPSNVVRDESGG